MSDPLLVAAERLAAAFAAVAGEPVDPVVRPSDRADVQANGALALAKTLERPPRVVAQSVLDAADGALDDICAKVEIAGPGFINLTFDDGFIAREVAAMARDADLGVSRAVTPETIVVDYSAPNVAKEMHVGHLRTTVIGDALVRLLGARGHTIVRENHIGDWGTPFGMLIEHLVDLGEAEAAHELSVGDLDGFYRGARAKFDANDEFKERARKRVVLLQSGDAETTRLWRVLVDESIRYFDEVYARLGVLLTDDDLRGESVYNDMLPDVVEQLRAAGLLVESDGADVVFPPGFTNREGEPLPLIIRKADGGYNYATTDLACVIDRVDRIGATLMVYVVGAPQSLHLQMVWVVAGEAGWLVPPARAVHVTFGNVLGSDRKILKSRSGESIKLVDLLDEAVLRADAAVADKNPSLSIAEREDVARAVGVGAVKYADLSTDRVKDYVFDWDRMLSFEGNTSPYLQYAHARICSIFRRAEVSRESVRNVAPIVGAPEERVLSLRLLGFDTAISDTIERFSPHRLCAYLYDVASDFTAFYESCPVLRAEDETTRLSRLAICDLTARVLERGLGLLGIDTPERM
jgi:arginyl-tRNA synthetase